MSDEGAAAKHVAMSATIRHSAFLLTMLGASALTFLRMTVVALLLPIGDFALYATVIATGAFLAGPLSFGAVEGTIKAFPRLVSEGREGRMLSDARAIWRLAALRTALFAVPLLAVGFFADVRLALLGGLGVLAAFGNATTSLVASMQRAAGSPQTLAGGTVFRAGLTFAAVSLASTSGQAAVVIAVEIASMVAASAFSEWYFFRRRHAQTEHAGSQPVAPDRSGMLVFASFTMISVPFYLDRLFVTTTMGELQAGQYGVLALILMGASLLVNTIAQRAGPEAIKRIHRGETGWAIRGVAGWIATNSLIWILALACFGLVIALGWLPQSLARYAIGIEMLVPLAVAGILLNTGLLEFLVIGMDREKVWSAAAAGFLFCVLASAAFVWTTKAGLVDLMWALATCRAVYMVALASIVASGARSIDGPALDRHRRNPDSNGERSGAKSPAIEAKAKGPT